MNFTLQPPQTKYILRFTRKYAIFYWNINKISNVMKLTEKIRDKSFLKRHRRHVNIYIIIDIKLSWKLMFLIVVGMIELHFNLCF